MAMDPPPAARPPAKDPPATAYWPNPAGGPGQPKAPGPPPRSPARRLCDHFVDVLEGLGAAENPLGPLGRPRSSLLLFRLAVKVLWLLLRFGIKVVFKS